MQPLTIGREEGGKAPHINAAQENFTREYVPITMGNAFHCLHDFSFLYLFAAPAKALHYRPPHDNWGAREGICGGHLRRRGRGSLFLLNPIHVCVCVCVLVLMYPSDMFKH
jgi:hypothetical protein